MMQNLARSIDRDNPKADPEVQEIVHKELAEAGITPLDMDIFLNSCGEVPTSVVGDLCKWSFRRAWSYWMAKGPGIPVDVAENFDQAWGKVVRADGDCACRGPRFWNEGFGTGSYHIDSQEGLNAFAALLRTIHQPRP